MGSTTAASGSETAAPIRAGVVGLGYFGTFHAEKYATLPGCDLVGVVDHNLEGAEKIATEYGAHAYTDHEDLIGLVDVVSVVTPVGQHYAVAKDFLEAGVHVLVEKSITETTEQAEELIQLAKKNGVTLQVGHVERFNPAFSHLPDDLRNPTYIETHRLTQFRQRAANVSVVLDLMIHDIDLVQSLVRSPVQSVQAKGISVYSDALDLVNAVVQFENGTVANLTASRVSMEPQRTLHLFQHQAYTCLDMQKKTIVTQRQTEGGGLDVDELQLENEDTLRAEVAAFLEAVKTGGEPVVTGTDGMLALDTAIRIAEAIEKGKSSNEPLPLGDGKLKGSGYVAHDHHPETREPFFSRTSLIDQSKTTR
ncbi:Gfo/Idh/MocA family protein [Marinimicrobium sp. ABcell2]|uniref:Gfo/Idh/MocA family protein n=1 Tax=Marinimicrobium sp. ABcell2 TaxID=3069751 RepID=UPI0027B3C3AF|nr:Gfo/Idh/MocA family oxidoreductase [Marinimicrobium sp. ABcell2]MDQ2078147.1 Gfo/Idh/MocA family oxidoreductase [Marinimicrobium sp. ABcell2]